MANDQFDNIESNAKELTPRETGEALLMASQEGFRSGDSGYSVARSFADGSYTQMNDLADRLGNPANYLEELKQLPVEALQAMLANNEATTISYRNFIAATEKRLSTAVSNV